MALKHRARTVVIGIVVLLAVLVALCAWYVSDYHHAVDVDSALASACDNGGVEDYQPNPMAGVAEVLERL